MGDRTEGEGESVGEEGDPGAEVGVRSCFISRTRHPREVLLRFVVDPFGNLVEDLSGRLPGRGIYVVPDRGTLQALAKRKDALRRFFPGGVAVPPMELLLPRLEVGFSRRLMDGIGLARRSGNLRTGLRGAEESLEGGEGPLLLLAADTAAHTREKFARLLARWAREGHEGESLEGLLDRERFGLACGKGPVAVLAVLGRKMVLRVRSDAWRWRTLFEVACLK
ncbi:MAG: DUF448 domain-containing protein [Magnetococcales bacterium]|nr:DUF448 domain-containing protein [Magnetococcales bacterium]